MCPGRPAHGPAEAPVEGANSAVPAVLLTCTCTYTYTYTCTDSFVCLSAFGFCVCTGNRIGGRRRVRCTRQRWQQTRPGKPILRVPHEQLDRVPVGVPTQPFEESVSQYLHLVEPL